MKPRVACVMGYKCVSKSLNPVLGSCYGISALESGRRKNGPRMGADPSSSFFQRKVTHGPPQYPNHCPISILMHETLLKIIVGTPERKCELSVEQAVFVQ